MSRNKRIVFTDNPKVQNAPMTRSNKKNLYSNMYGNVGKGNAEVTYDDQEEQLSDREGDG